MATRLVDNSKRNESSVLFETKKRLCEQFLGYVNKHGINQRELAARIETDESVVSKILHIKVDEFTTDFLVKKLNALYSDIEIKIRARD